MEEYCETHQLVRKRREIFENLANKKTEVPKIQNTHTSHPWSRNISKPNVALKVVPVKTSSHSTSVKTASDSVSINSSVRNKTNNYGENSKSVVFSGSEPKLNKFVNRIAVIKSEQMCDKIRASEYIDDTRPIGVDDERYSEQGEFSDSFDSDTEEECDDYKATRLPPPIQQNIGSTRNTIKEIITTEENYVKNLQVCIKNYVTCMENDLTLPLGLRGHKNQIFFIYEKIHEFHQNKFLPALLQANYDLDAIIAKFLFFIKHDYFYCYVLYAMNKPRLDAIVCQNEQFFKDQQYRVGDKLGLAGFLMKPIVQLPRYRLFVNEIIKQFMKNNDKNTNNGNLTNTFENLRLVEKELLKVLDAANGSVSLKDIQFNETFIDVRHQGKFIRCGEFEIQHILTPKNKYQGKVFLFEKALIYTEYETTDKQGLIYRGSYDCQKINLSDSTDTGQTNKQKFYIFDSKIGLKFSRTDDNNDNWYEILQQVVFDVAEKKQTTVK